MDRLLTCIHFCFAKQGPLKAAQIPTFLIGGAEKAIGLWLPAKEQLAKSHTFSLRIYYLVFSNVLELDAKCAVDQGTRLAAVIETGVSVFHLCLLCCTVPQKHTSYRCD